MASKKKRKKSKSRKRARRATLIKVLLILTLIPVIALTAFLVRYYYIFDGAIEIKLGKSYRPDETRIYAAPTLLFPGKEIGPAELESDFTGFLEGKILVCANEIVAKYFRSKRAVANKIKNLVVGDPLMINRKGVDQHLIANYSNWLFLSNDSGGPLADCLCHSLSSELAVVFLSARIVFSEANHPGSYLLSFLTFTTPTGSVMLT